jgi:hypothetical protein
MYRRYAWFGALRNAENLHAVHPFNRLMDDSGEVTPLYVSYHMLEIGIGADW